MPNIKRLERLVIVLDEVRTNPAKAREFDLKDWAKDVGGCGTHLCACGWAASDPVLNAAGLILGPRSIYDNASQIHFGPREGFKAVARFFGISNETAERLFHPEDYKNSTDIQPVINRVKRVLSKAKSARKSQAA